MNISSFYFISFVEQLDGFENLICVRASGYEGDWAQGEGSVDHWMVGITFVIETFPLK